MKFLCLAYYDAKAFAAAPRDEVAAITSQCAQHDRALRDSGGLLAVASLAQPAIAKSLRPRKGATMVTDGPYAETKEQLGAFFVVEATSLDDAARIASLHPAARVGERLGWGIEVRPIEMWDAPALAKAP